MKTSTVTNAFSNPVSITVLIILLAISAGLYLLQMIGIPVLVILVIISLLIGVQSRSPTSGRKPLFCEWGNLAD